MHASMHVSGTHSWKKSGGRRGVLVFEGGGSSLPPVIRMGLLKEHQREDVEALQTAVLGLLYRAEEDLA
jgi:hypothetical protein